MPTSNCYPYVRWALLIALMVFVAACGGGGGNTNITTASTGNGSNASTTTTTVALTDAAANARAVASMASNPVNAAVWGQLNTAGADSARSLVASADAVVVSTFKTVVDPTGGPGTINVFEAVVAKGSLDAGRVFQLRSGTMPAVTTPIWVNVAGEDFTKNNPTSESALETTGAALRIALVKPLP